MDMENSPVTFQNMHIKPYNYPTEDTIINNPEKTVDRKISTPFDYLETKKPRKQGRPRKNHFTNYLIDKTVDIFMSHRERADYKLALKLQNDGVIITPRNPFDHYD